MNPSLRARVGEAVRALRATPASVPAFVAEPAPGDTLSLDECLALDGVANALAQFHTSKEPPRWPAKVWTRNAHGEQFVIPLPDSPGQLTHIAALCDARVVALTGRGAA